MRYLLILCVSFLTTVKLYPQIKDASPGGFDFLNSIHGVWEGIPNDSSFISVLDYRIDKKLYFGFVANDLLSIKRQPFSHYEGVYFHNPHTSRLEYTTINGAEIHTGYCEVRQDTLFHYAVIKNTAGKIRAYSSAIVRIDNQTFSFYAVYGKDEKIPVMMFQNPLVYRRVKVK
jgi:hypothetical protein